MEHMHRMCALHEKITDTGNHVNTDVTGDALFDDLVSLMAVYAAEKYGTGLREVGIGVFEDLPDIRCGDYIETLVQAVGFDQFLHSLSHIPDHQGRDRLIPGEIDPVGTPAPEDGQSRAPQHCRDKREGVW